jgi:hypothetical protein
LGTVISLLALFFAVLVGMGVIETLAIQLIFYYTGVLILICGFIVILFSAINFPAFYEFEWRENLIELFIINKTNNKCVFYYNFQQFLDKNDKTVRGISETGQLYSSGLSGIDAIVSRITGTNDKRIDKIEHDNKYIFLDYGAVPFNLTFALAIKKDLISLRHLLLTIKKQFESFYREVLYQLDSFKGPQDLLFGSFEVILQSLIQ